MSARADKEAARKLWDDLRGHFANAEKSIAKIIETKAWEPLGYASFAEAWADKMQGVRLATDSIRAHVVYALFDCGLSDDEVLGTVGMGSLVATHSVVALRRQKVAGVPAWDASTRVRSHLRRPASPPRTVHVLLNDDDYEAFRLLAKEAEISAGELGAKVISEYMKAGVMA